MAVPATPARRRLPFLQGLLPIDRARVPAELIAGVTLAALAIPEVMGYSKIAGMPVITGLYTIVLPIAVFALVGSSRHLVVGADSATAAILAAGLAGMAATGSAEYVALAGMLALLAGGFLLLARLARLGFLADFLSRTVLIGFLTGVGVQVACGQVGGMLDVSKGTGGPIDQLVTALGNIGSLNWPTVAVSGGVLAVILVGGRFAPRIPWPLVAVIGAIMASSALDLAAHGVTTLGPVPSGLPSLGLPDVGLSKVPSLLGTAFSIFIVILAQSAATSRAYAARFGDRLSEDEDLVGLGLANAAAGISGTYVVNGSPTKTAMVDQAGGRSQLAQLVTALVVVVVLLFLTGPLADMPNAVLSSVVFLIAVRLVDVQGMREILRLRPVEFAVALITAITVVVVSVEDGIILAIVLSMVAHLRHSYRPHDRLLVPTAAGSWRTAPLAGNLQAAPGLLIYRFGASLYYANADRCRQEIMDLVHAAEPDVRWMCVSCEAVGDVDFTASATLRALDAELTARKVTLVLAGVEDAVRSELDRDGLTKLIGPERFHPGLDEVLTAYRGLTAPGPGGPPATPAPPPPAGDGTS